MSRKYDSAKPRPELLPVDALLAVTEVLAYGAKKYTTETDSGDDNWRRPGFSWRRLLGSSLRHLLAFMRGEDKDPESGLSHLAHLACNAMFLLEHQIHNLGADDRFKYPERQDELDRLGDTLRRWKEAQKENAS